ncbi:sensor histidine kinase [Leifsonia poae]|uniref:sensor histidine kinase n=1 Tax=Leifsonia poae TaxID=110933 RepID=UPI0027E18FC6|nr:HAMP domain-containing sensor histidine kinase [Leifsonia poae]
MTRRPKRDIDAVAVRRASRIVGLQITIASGALVVAAIGFAFFFVLDQLRPAELEEKPRPGEHKIYIDSTEALFAFVVLGVLAVAVAGTLSLVITRRAVNPLGRALAIQRTFVQDASHELRTPLAVLDARLQLLQRSLPPADPSTDVVAELRADTRTLIDVVNDLLLAADDSREDDPAAATPVVAPVAKAVNAMRMLAGQRSIEIALDSEGDPSTLVPATGIQRCTTALLDNALTHAPDGSTVLVTVRSAHRQVILRVADAGPGIQGIEPERIFDRFARAPRQHTSPTQRLSFGIGLALVREIAVRHGGSVTVAETGPRGTVLELVLPEASLS